MPSGKTRGHEIENRYPVDSKLFHDADIDSPPVVVITGYRLRYRH